MHDLPVLADGRGTVVHDSRAFQGLGIWEANASFRCRAFLLLDDRKIRDPK